jgi:hypothetical protein
MRRHETRSATLPLQLTQIAHHLFEGYERLVAVNVFLIHLDIRGTRVSRTILRPAPEFSHARIYLPRGAPHELPSTSPGCTGAPMADAINTTHRRMRTHTKHHTSSAMSMRPSCLQNTTRFRSSSYVKTLPTGFPGLITTRPLGLIPSARA